MKRLLIVIALLPLLVPAAYAVTPAGVSQADDSAAARQCRTERQSMGVQAFNEKYGTNKNKKNAFGKCVSGKSKGTADDADENDSAAARQCRSERQSMGVQAFNDKYGTNKNKKNAFGKCVSGKTR